MWTNHSVEIGILKQTTFLELSRILEHFEHVSTSVLLLFVFKLAPSQVHIVVVEHVLKVVGCLCVVIHVFKSQLVAHLIQLDGFKQEAYLNQFMTGDR